MLILNSIKFLMLIILIAQIIAYYLIFVISNISINKKLAFSYLKNKFIKEKQIQNVSIILALKIIFLQ